MPNNNEVLNNNMSSQSEIIDISSTSEVKKVISTNSETKRVISTESEIKKGSIDIYGNVIDYDPNDWVGEDVEEEKEIIKSSEFRIGEEYGTLDISIPDSMPLDNTNIELSIIDQGYNMHNVYIYYKNNYHEKIKMSKGKYTISNMSFLGVDGSAYKLSNREFNIENGETTYITIDYKLGEKREEIIATQSEIVKEEIEVKNRNSFIGIIYSIVFIIIIVCMALFIMKKKKSKDE